MKKLLLLIIVSLIAGSCRYKPFVKYYFPNKKEGFPRFSKLDYLQGETNNLRAYDITTYDWYVKVDPEKERIAGLMTIEFEMEMQQDSILIDLHSKLKVDNIESSFPIKNWKHRKDLLYIVYSEPVEKGVTGSINIAYHGKPANISNEGPIQWRTDSNGNPWISTQTEGIGAHYMMPCKELLYDEPEQCFIRVEVPGSLVVAANGTLDSVTTKGENRVYHHSVLNPINIYNISFNIGDYEKITFPYTDINGEEQEIQVFALSHQIDTARSFYSQAPLHVKELEKLYGSFPWWRDGCKIVQTTLGGSAMEHQSAISMGSYFYNDYAPPKYSLKVNTTLIHELAHEWWGNLLTGNDYCDMWLHEGLATYAEALVIEQLYQPNYYGHYMWLLSLNVANERPILKPCGVRYNSWVSPKDGDIYYKGALLLHTLRMQIGDDEAFFSILKGALTTFAKQNITTGTFINYFNEMSKKDYSPLFEVYLEEKSPPVLLYSYDSTQSTLSFKWKTGFPDNFPFKVVATLSNDKIALTPTNSLQQIEMKSMPIFKIGDFGYVLTEELE
ncbi:M1 family metallopeptidase [Ekhidna sp.]|uniref:M1 family metallopeptidase n=1 Tax=Ekhidna sp. TaxID=2608089 RepID=UPI003BABADE2